MKESLHIEIEPELTKTEAYAMGEPRLLLGQGRTIENGRASSFQLFDKPLFASDEPIKLLLVYFSNYDTRGLINLF